MKQFIPLMLLLSGLMVTSCVERPDPSLVLNEICGKEFPDNDWIELYNAADTAIHLKGVYLIKIDEDGIDHVIFRFKEGTLLPGQVCVVSSLDHELRRRLSHKKELGIELIGPDDKTLDAFYRDEEVGENAHPTNGSYARIPNGTGQWAIVAQASRNQLNPDDAEIIEVDFRTGDLLDDEEDEDI